MRGYSEFPDKEEMMNRAWTTRVSNPVCSPRFRSSASVLGQVVAFASDVPADLYGCHSYTSNSTTLSRTQDTQFQKHVLG